MYFPLRIKFADQPLVDMFSFEKTIEVDDPMFTKMYYGKFCLVIINVLLVPVAMMKMLNYLRLHENFGLFIILVGECILDIRIFLIFMIMWIIIFSIILYILNCNIPNYSDYPHMWRHLQLTM